MLKLGSLRVRHDKVVPNNWNPNEMDSAFYAKLKAGLQQALLQGREIPPIVVRHHPKGKTYEIIDGYHRHKALGELGLPKINVYAIEADDKDARVLTNTLNYLRGRPDRGKYGQGIVEMLELGASLDDLAEMLPENRDDLEMLLQESQVSLEALQQLHTDDQGNGSGDDALEALSDSVHEEEAFVELKFRVSAEQAQVIESEIQRISAILKGKNVRGRALEYMAALSRQGNAA